MTVLLLEILERSRRVAVVRAHERHVRIGLHALAQDALLIEAWPAPRGPEVEHHRLPLQAGDADRELLAKGLYRELRSASAQQGRIRQRGVLQSPRKRKQQDRRERDP